MYMIMPQVILKAALWVERSLARHRHPCATPTPMAREPCACGPPLFALAEARNWRAHGLSLTFTQQSPFAITMLPILKPIPIGPQKLSYLYFLHGDS